MKNSLFIILAIFVLITTACSDWLDVRPKTQEPANEMFETLEGYQDALTGCYIKMKSTSIYGRDLLITTTEYLAQHWDVATSFGETSTSTLAAAIKSYKYDDDNVKSSFQSIYSGLYNVIVQTNTILEALPLTGETAITDVQMRSIIEAEALAIRAYCHFDILRLFGQVPNGSKQIKLPYTEDVSREPVKYYSYTEFTKKLEDDLIRAEKLLEKHDPFVDLTVSQVNGWGSTGEVRVEEPFMLYRQLRLNYWAVKALQARFYLYIGGRDNDALAAAKIVVGAALDGKGFALAGYSNFEAGYNALPGEGIFMLSNHQIKNYVTSLFPGNVLNAGTGANLYMSPEKLEDMFEEPVAGSTNNRYQKLWSHDKKNQFGTICPEIRKYYQADDSGLSSSILLLHKQIMPMLRLSEMYLVIMELSNDLTEINDLYFKYREARNLIEMPFISISEAREFVPKEYRREFFGEGQMFFYYKRNFTQRMLWVNSDMTEDNYIVPLPETEFDPN